MDLEGVDELSGRVLPYPLTAALCRLREAQGDDRQVRDCLIDTMELTVRFLTLLFLTDYLGTGRRDKSVESKLPRLLDAPTIGAWYRLGHEIASALPAPFIAELSCFFASQNHPWAKEIGRGIDLRNTLVHGGLDAPPPEMQQLCTELWSSVRGIFRELAIFEDVWLCSLQKTIPVSSTVIEHWRIFNDDRPAGALYRHNRDASLPAGLSKRVILFRADRQEALFVDPMFILDNSGRDTTSRMHVLREEKGDIRYQNPMGSDIEAGKARTDSRLLSSNGLSWASALAAREHHFGRCSLELGLGSQPLSLDGDRRRPILRSLAPTSAAGASKSPLDGPTKSRSRLLGCSVTLGGVLVLTTAGLVSRAQSQNQLPNRGTPVGAQPETAPLGGDHEDRPILELAHSSGGHRQDNRSIELEQRTSAHGFDSPPTDRLRKILEGWTPDHNLTEHLDFFRISRHITPEEERYLYRTHEIDLASFQSLCGQATASPEETAP